MFRRQVRPTVITEEVIKPDNTAAYQSGAGGTGLDRRPDTSAGCLLLRHERSMINGGTGKQAGWLFAIVRVAFGRQARKKHNNHGTGFPAILRKGRGITSMPRKNIIYLKHPVNRLAHSTATIGLLSSLIVKLDV